MHDDVKTVEQEKKSRTSKAPRHKEIEEIALWLLGVSVVDRFNSELDFLTWIELTEE